VNSGDTANFTLTVTNPGNVDLNNVAVTDALCDAAPVLTGGDTNTDGILQQTETWTYTCSTANVTADFTNTADVSAQAPDTTIVNASDTADVTVNVVVTNPAIAIDKTPDAQTVNSGDTANFTLTVTNTGDVDLSNVVVTDALCDAAPVLTGGDTNTDNILQQTETWTYTCATANVTASFSNTGNASGQAPDTTIVNASDTAFVTVNAGAPSVDIQKTPDTQTVAFGATVTFDIRVENNGTTDLTNVVVIDALVPACNNTIGALAVGAVVQYSCTSAAGATTNFTNVAVVTADGGITDTDSADVTVNLAAGIDMTKTANTPTVAPGGTANFTITIENTGNVALSNVNLTDAICTSLTLTGGDTNSNSVLDVGEIWTVNCDVANVTADFTNTADVSAQAPDTSTVTDTASASVTVTPAAPAVDVTKTANTPTVAYGGTANFLIEVANTGNVPLSNPATNDPLCTTLTYLGGDTNSNGVLDVGETWSGSCDVANVTVDFTNTVDVSGEAPGGAIVTDTDSASVTVGAPPAPAISIDVVAITPIVNAGDTASLSITIDNTGTEPLTPISFIAPACTTITLVGGDTNGNGIIDPGESWVVNCDVVNVTVPTTVLATIYVLTPAGATISAADSDLVSVNGSTATAPAIDLIGAPATQTITSGGTALFSLAVVNTGNEDLVNVNVTSPVASCLRTFATLAVGEIQTFTCAGTSTVDFINTVQVDGTSVTTTTAVSDTVALAVTVTSGPAPTQTPPPSGNPTTDTPTSQSFSVLDPFISKIADPPFAIPGENITFTFVVTNSGATPATNVVAVDPMPAQVEVLSATASAGTVTISGQDVTLQQGVMQPGESITVTIETRVRPNVAVPFTIVNEACVTGDTIPADSCATATVISISSLPSTGETPLWATMLRAILYLGMGLALTVVTWTGRRTYLRMRG
jgi:uncharacterized repeat protein (TIGR01451 family)